MPRSRKKTQLTSQNPASSGEELHQLLALLGSCCSAGEKAAEQASLIFQRLAEEARNRHLEEIETAARALADHVTGWPPSRPLREAFELLEDELLRLAQALEAQGLPAEQVRALAGAAGQPEVEPNEPPDLASDPDLLREFVAEAQEHLEQIETQALVLEKDPAEAEALHAAFRAFHTLKGLAGFLQLEPIRAVAHELESILAAVRDGELQPQPDLVDLLLEGGDFLKEAVAAVEQSLQSGAPLSLPDAHSLVERLRIYVQVARERDRSLNGTHSAGSQAPEASSLPGVEAEARREAAVSGLNSSPFVRVSTAKLDYLVDMVGELVVAQALLENVLDARSLHNPKLLRALSQLSRITSEVQRTAMSMRMVPVGVLFRRMARLVRDLGRQEGKKVELVTAGDDTELDRNIVEALTDPLLHMIRNAVGHGIEPPQERLAAGKPETGQIRLAASHQAGFIQIELSDDGRGLQKQKILEKARSLGLVSTEAELSETEIYNLIFRPGFSTAARVSDVSGRGVGMDVVQRNISRLRGRVEVFSTEGKGTTFLLKLPLTLAIIEGLIVKVGDQRYIVPIYTVREMFRPTASMLSSIHGKAELVLVRGRLLPLVRLYEVFGIVPRTTDPTQALVLVAESLGKPFCLMVDELIGKQEVVIKSLGPALGQLPGFSGGAILGDGKVGLILDVENLYRLGAQHGARAA